MLCGKEDFFFDNQQPTFPAADILTDVKDPGIPADQAADLRIMRTQFDPA
jgi:hypothetical protein